MVFDGVCNFCSSTVRLVMRMDRHGVIRFTAMQTPYGQGLCRANGIDPADPSTFLFFAHGRALEGSDAMLAMVARLPRPWRWLVWLRLIPRAPRDAVYRWTARHRYRLLGKRQTCMVPAPAVRARFIDQSPQNR